MTRTIWQLLTSKYRYTINKNKIWYRMKLDIYASQSLFQTFMSIFCLCQTVLSAFHHISGVMVSVLASNAVDHGFKPIPVKTKDYKIGICCFSAEHAALRSKSKDELAWYQDNVSEWCDMSAYRLLFQWASTITNPIKRVGLVTSGPHHHLIENNLFSPWYL